MRHQPKYPDFLCIGAQKSGTTWLFANLRDHPRICIPWKEIEYFNLRGQGVRSLYRQAIWNKARREELIGRLFQQDWSRTYWFIRYLFLRRTDSWYASLFRCCRDSLVGDMSTSYSTLDDDDVRHVAEIMPEAKIILLLRDPVERAWSHARMDFNLGLGGISASGVASFEDLPFDTLRRHFDSYPSTSRSSYGRMLQVWKSHFPNKQIFVGFKEEIDRDPGSFLDRVARFLDLDPPAGTGWPRGGQRIFAQPAVHMPPEVEHYLSQKYLGMLRLMEETPLLDDRHRSYVSGWRQRAERRLADTTLRNG